MPKRDKLYLAFAAVFSAIIVLTFVFVQGSKGLVSFLSLVLSGWTLLFLVLIYAYPSFQSKIKSYLQSPQRMLIGLLATIFCPYVLYVVGNPTLLAIGLTEIAIYMLLPSFLLFLFVYFKKANYYLDLLVFAILFFAFDHRLIKHIWGYPEGYSYVYNSLYLVVIMLYNYLVMRNIPDIGFSFAFKQDDIKISILNLIPIIVIVLPLALITGFVTPRTEVLPLYDAFISFFGIFLTIATIEELAFRGIFLNILIKITKNDKISLVISSILFGLIHWDNTPVPDWRYILLATIAGIFYGLSYLKKRKLLPAILLHTYVDTIWHYFFL